MEIAFERTQAECPSPSNALISTSQLSPARVTIDGSVVRLFNPSCKTLPTYHRYSNVSESPSLSSSPAMDVERSSSEVGFDGDMAVEEIEGREFKTVIVFEFTEVPKSWPSLGVTDACQSSPRVISSLEIVNNPSNCV